MPPKSIPFLAGMASYLAQIQQSKCTDDRKKDLEPLVHFIRAQQAKGQRPMAHFICTHNSRRSQFAQFWAQVAADYYGVAFDAHSGGTEVTALHMNALAALQRAGAKSAAMGLENPKYTLWYAEDRRPISLYSKLFSELPTPVIGYAAVMTCSAADQSCPSALPGATRLALLYDDPKAFDGSPQEAQAYDERCLQIASEMFYVFAQIPPSPHVHP